MKLLKCILLLTTVLWAAYSESVKGEARVVFQKADNPVEKEILKTLKSDSSVDSVIGLINQTYKLPGELIFVFGGEDGPLYDGNANQIIIPYFFLEEVKSRFVKANYAETGVKVEDATMDALMHTMLHEFAHAIIFIYQLPILGKEEDAADSLASFILIESFEEGQEIAISAADLFDLESEDRNVLEEQDFWGEHSLDLQRYYSTLCHVYGSDPEKNAAIIKHDYFSKDRAELCIQDYENLSRSVNFLLSPYMKNNQ